MQSPLQLLHIQILTNIISLKFIRICVICAFYPCLYQLPNEILDSQIAPYLHITTSM